MNRRGRLGVRLIQAGFLAVVVLIWHLATYDGAVNAVFLPALPGVWTHFVDILVTGDFWDDMKVTVYELIVAFAIASTTGCTIGYLVSRTRYLIRTFDPLFAGIYSIPAILIFPLYVLLLGLGPESKIAIGATIGFFPVVLSTIAGFGNVDRIYLTAARSMGATGFRLFWHVLLPAAFPVIVTGLRMGFILAFLAILGSETISSTAGLGHRIVSLAEAMSTARMFAFIVFVIFIAILLNALVSYAEARGKRG